MSSGDKNIVYYFRKTLLTKGVNIVRLQIIVEMKVYIVVLWALKPCDLEGDYRTFGGTCCLCCQGKAFYYSSASGLRIFLSLGFYCRD